MEIMLNQGTYIIIPGSLGCLLQKTKGGETKVIPDFCAQNVKGFGYVIHPMYRSTFWDIFRKIDLDLLGLVGTSDLNLLGAITGISYITNVVDKDFKKGGKFA